MAIHFDPVRPAAIPVKTPLPVRPHAAAPSVPQPLVDASGAKVSSSEGAAAFSAIFAPTPRATAVHRTSPPASPIAAPAPAVTPTTASPAPAAAPTALAAAVTTPAANHNAVFTAEQVFGPNPWLSNPMGTGPNGITFGYNPLYFATPSTAAAVAQMVGGTVVEDNEFTKNTPGTPFAQRQPNEMVQLPSGALINPGLIASLYTHGLPQWEVDQAVANEVASANASVNSIQS